MILFLKRLLYFIFLSFLNINFCCGKKCLTTKISDITNCQICLPKYYQIDFLESLTYRKIDFPENNCIFKIFQKNRRNITIQSKQCENCDSFDAIYFKFATALEEESRIALRYIENEIYIYFQSGNHFIHSQDFSIESPEFFRFTQSSIFIRSLSESGKVSLYFNTTLFSFYVSKLLIIENVDFFGNFNNDCNTTHCSINSSFIYEARINENIKLVSTSFGLFNLELYTDDLIYPSLFIKNSSFQGFRMIDKFPNGFTAIFKVNAGLLTLEDVILDTNSFTLGFIYATNEENTIGTLYLLVPNHLEVFVAISLKNLRIIRLVQHQNPFIILKNFELNFLMENIIFESIYDSLILLSEYLIIVDYFIIQNVIVNNASNFSFIQCNSIKGIVKFFSLDASFINGISIFFDVKFNEKIIITRVYLGNFVMKNILSLFYLEESESDLQNFLIENSLVFKFIEQNGNILTFRNCSAMNVKFLFIFLFFQRINVIMIDHCVFHSLQGQLAFFYLLDAYNFEISYFLLKNSTIEFIYFLENVQLLLSNNTIYEDNFINYFIDMRVNINSLNFEFMIFQKNIVQKFFFKNTDIDQSNFVFKNLVLEKNNFLTYCIVYMSKGLAYFASMIAIKNYFIYSDQYLSCFDFELESEIYMVNCHLEDNGIISKKYIYKFFSENCMIYIWYIKNIIFEKVNFIASQNIDLTSGFIGSSPLGEFLNISDSNFIILSRNPLFEYKGIILDSPKNVNFNNISFYNLVCGTRSFSHYNGAIHISSSANFKYSLNSNIILLNNCIFVNCSCLNGGSLSVISTFSVQIQNCLFKNSSSEFLGGSLHLVANPFVKLTNLCIFSSKSNEGGGLFLSDSLNVKIKNITLNSMQARKTGIIYIAFIKLIEISDGWIGNTITFLKGGSFFIFSSFIFISNFIITNSSSNEGGAFFFQGLTNVTINNMKIIYSTALKGGALKVNNILNMSFINSFLIDTFSRYNGALLSLDNFKFIFFDSNMVLKSKTEESGVIFSNSPDENSIMLIKNNSFEKCFSKGRGSILYHLSPSIIDILSIKIEEFGNFAFYFYSSFSVTIKIKNLSITKAYHLNTSIILTFGINLILELVTCSQIDTNQAIIFVEYGMFKLSNMSINNFSCPFAINIKDSIFQISIIYVKNIEKKQASFLNIIQSKGEIIEIKLEQLISITNSLIVLNNVMINITKLMAINNGGTLLELSRCNINISSFFIHNYNEEISKNYEIVYFDNWESHLYLVYLSNLFAHSFNTKDWMSFFGLIEINIFNSTFFNTGTALTSCISYSLFYSLKIIYSVISNFLNHGMQLEAEDSLKYSSLFITASFFMDNKAPFGGIAYLFNIFHINISFSIFLNNIANFNGTPNLKGKIGFGESFLIATSNHEKDERIVILYQNIFRNDNRDKYITEVFSMIEIYEDGSNQFKNSFAFFYLMSYPLNIKNSNIERESQGDDSINIESGKTFNISFDIVDKFNNLIFFDSNSVFSLKLYSKNENKITIENGVSKANSGKITFDNLKIVSKPNSNFTLVITGFLNPFDNDKDQFTYQKELNFHSKNCSFGEVILIDYSCFKCPTGFFSLFDPMTTEIKFQSCKSCPPNAQCLGGYIINPNPGYFRKDIFSDNINECLIKSSCLGLINYGYNYSQQEFENLNGGCLKGNSGNLCFNCEYGYGRYEKKESCQKCNSFQKSAFLRLGLYVFCILVIILLNVFSAENHAGNETKEISIDTLNKFLVTHSQQLSTILISSQENFDFHFFESYIEFSDFASFSNPFALTNDCILQNLIFHKEFFILFKEMQIILIPVIFAIISFSIWLFLHFFFGKFERFQFLKEKLPNTIHVFAKKFSLFIFLSAYFFYALILKTCFSLFDCMELSKNEKKYLKINPDILCWEGNHIIYLLVSIPGIFIWGLLFPLFLRFMLIRNYNLIYFSKPLEYLKKVSFRAKNEDNSGSKEIISENKILIAESRRFKIVPMSKKRKIIQLVKNRMAFLFFNKDYTTNCKNWESYIFLRKFIINFIYSFQNYAYLELKFLGIFFYMVSSIILTKKAMPYKKYHCNYLELLSLYSIGTSIIANFLIASDINLTCKYLAFSFSALFNGFFYLLTFSFTLKYFQIKLKKLTNKKGERSKKKVRFFDQIEAD